MTPLIQRAKLESLDYLSVSFIWFVLNELAEIEETRELREMADMNFKSHAIDIEIDELLLKLTEDLCHNVIIIISV